MFRSSYKVRQFTGATQTVLRVIFIFIIVAFALFILLGFVSRCIPSIRMPDATEAPWIIQTSSRIYYASEYTLLDDVPAIRGYWTTNGKTYRFVNDVKTFPFELYGQISVIRRTGK
jgi:hypothetical protein